MSFAVASYNVLADSYVKPKWYPGVPAALLVPGARTPALARHIEALGADIVCLQEVEPAVFTAVRKHLEPLGYEGHYARKAAGRPDGWPERRREICDFLDVPFEDEPVLDVAEVERIAGRYGDGRREVAVAAVGRRLVVRGIHWRNDVLLLPVRRNVFDVESWPVRACFTVDPAGRVDGF